MDHPACCVCWSHRAPPASVNNGESRKQTRLCDSTDTFNVVGLIYPPPPTQLPVTAPPLETEVDFLNFEQVLFLLLTSSFVWWKRALVIRGASKGLCSLQCLLRRKVFLHEPRTRPSGPEQRPGPAGPAGACFVPGSQWSQQLVEEPQSCRFHSRIYKIKL